MIAFGSQRAGGADLATHLSNGEDNEYVERVEGRGAIAGDTHGAFAEWEAAAHAMTRCKNYLYSLSINPDPAQGSLTHEQFMDYIERAELSLGLTGQPREVYRHIKEDRLGELRDHYHCVWSRIDVQACKAIPVSFDKRKLMMVSREFAHDHDLKLPEGYETGRAKAAQLSLYQKVQQDLTGLTREERTEVITDLWRTSDSAKAFVAGLEEHGYMLATGRRPYVLVDIYGHTNALPRMIDDKQVRAKDVVAFLERDFPAENLPDVDEAKELAAAHYKEHEALRRSDKRAEELEDLRRTQAVRTEKLKGEIKLAEDRHNLESAHQRTTQQHATVGLALKHASENLGVQFERAGKTPKGVMGFFARYTGVEFIRERLQMREDKLREQKQMLEREAQTQRQEEKAQELAKMHQLQRVELERKETAQAHVFEREKRSLKTKYEQERAMTYRRGARHMPALDLTLTPGGRQAVPHKAVRRYYAPTVKEANVKEPSKRGKRDMLVRDHKPRIPQSDPNQIELREDFRHAAGRPLDKKSGSSKAPGAEFRPQDKDRGGGKKR